MKKSYALYILLLSFSWMQSQFALSADDVNDKIILTLTASKAKLNKETVDKARRGGITVVSLKDEAAERVGDDGEEGADIIFKLRAPERGVYTLTTHVERLDTVIRGQAVTTRNAKLKVNDQRLTRRIVSNALNYDTHVLGQFHLMEREQEIKIWLPKKVAFKSLEISAYTEDTVPAYVVNYEPQIVPHTSHPRIWLTQETLPMVRERLTHKENQKVWNEVQEIAKLRYPFEYQPDKETFYIKELESAAQAKAFYFLMTDDEEIGREAVRLMSNYMTSLEFGNVKHGDITREIGRALYSAALVYDWCFSLLTEEEKTDLYYDMMRVAKDMEIGWPPFRDVVVNGHASEAQVNRDLLSMAIAIYDKDPVPYQYVSYLLLEEMIPMRAFEYQSPRHNQGIDYGAYRHAWEMHAAWILYRMTGAKVFKDNITNLKNYWLYMRLPNGSLFRDGDVFSNYVSAWNNPDVTFLDYSYDNDPIIKAEFEHQGGKISDPLLFLLLNNPDLKPRKDHRSLPLTLDFGDVLGGMIARTGWDMSEKSNDVVAEIKGGGYHFGNHQHADAGAIQIYYRGRQVCDLGIYSSYGIPYDFNFNKRSVAHSMMLVKDPSEELLFRSTQNDGGTRFNQRTPRSPEEAMTDPWFDNGTVLSVGFEPTQAPSYSYFKVDLTAAYTSKVSKYTRSFCFLNLKRDDIPAAIILADDITAAKEDFSKFWKVNALHMPSKSDKGLVIENSEDGLVGKTHIEVLLPRIEDRDIELSSLRDTSSVLGPQFQIKKNLPEASGYQAIVYPRDAKKHNRFVTVFQMAADNNMPLDVDFIESDGKYFIRLADRIVCMSAEDKLIQTTFNLNVDRDHAKVVLTDMKPGFWNISNVDKSISVDLKVEPRNNSVSYSLPKGDYRITTGRIYSEVNE